MNKILLNGLHYSKNGAGISQYTYKLFTNLNEKNYDLNVLLRNEFNDKFDSDKYIYANRNINSSKDRIIYEQLMANKLYENYDLVHFPDYATPVLYRGKKIATIHDMAMYTMMDKYTKRQVLTKSILLKNTVKHADKLICDSEFSKRELLRYYPEAEEKATVVYCGIDIEKNEIDKEFENTILNKYSIEENKYILYVGTIAPQKNIENLIKAFELAKEQGLDYKLVIAGKKGWGYDNMFKYITENNLSDSIVFTDYIEDLDLEVLYKNAGVFSTISLYEGFGFPPLEAMGRNIPVLVSDIEIFRETCMDAAIYCNPNSIQDISNNMLNIIQDNILQNKLKTRGKERIKLFNWEQCAKQVYDIYLDVLK